MSGYKITINGTSYNLSDLIDTTGSSISTYYTGFPTSSMANCNFEKLGKNINYLENGVDLQNKCTAKSKSANTTFNYTVPGGISKISAIFAGGGGGGGGGGPTGNADNDNNNDSGGGGGGGGGGAIAVLKNYAVTAGQNITVNVGAAGVGAAAQNNNVAAAGGKGGDTILTINGVELLSSGGGLGGSPGNSGNANSVGFGGAGGAGGYAAPHYPVSDAVSKAVSLYSGNKGSDGANANKGTPGKGGNGGIAIDVNNQSANLGVFNTYTSTGGIGPNQTSNSIGQPGGSAPLASSNSFSGGGGGGSGCGQTRENTSSTGGNGAAGFAIIYLYF